MNETRTRECDCPPWVIRCAHFGDVLIAIRDEFAVVETLGERNPHVPAHPRYRLIDELDVECTCGIRHARRLDDDQIGDFLPEAEAAFDVAVRRLLDGERLFSEASR